MELLHGDCIEVMRGMEDNSVDAIVTDPPYGLGSVKDLPALLTAWMGGDSGENHVGSSGFMSKDWDKSVPPPTVWKEALRVLKSGGHLLVFAGTRTQDLMGISIRLAGAELRDEIAYFGTLHWVYASGFPKNRDVSKAIDKEAGAERDVVGKYQYPDGSGARRVAPCKSQTTTGRVSGSFNITAPATEAAKQWDGWGTALKPAHEPILMFRKTLSEKTIAANVLKWGTGGLNIDGTRIEAIGKENHKTPGSAKIGTNNKIFGVGKEGKNLKQLRRYKEGLNPRYSSKGRFPANVIHDGSQTVLDLFPETASRAHLRNNKPSKNVAMSGANYGHISHGCNDKGSAARFFYCAKASKSERNMGLGGNANHHPCVKPLKLMRYLVRLVTPPGETILDPFMGSGTTGMAAWLEGFKFIGIESEAEYFNIAKNRINKQTEG